MKKFKSCYLSVLLTIAIAVCLSLSPGLARAVPILDFAVDAPTPGLISYAIGSNPLVGVNIQVDNITGLDTPSNSDVVLLIHNGVLNFTTGNLTSSSPDSWQFSGGGVITIKGGIPTIGIADDTTLLRGIFTMAEVDKSGPTFKVAITSFFDFKNEELKAYYGLANVTQWEGNFNLSFNATGLPPNGFISSKILSGDISNSPVPEPATMFLLGSGLVGLAGFGRKFKKLIPF